MRPFDELCLKEPRLKQLEQQILEHGRRYGKDEYYCAPWNWYGYGILGVGFKQLVQPLAGFGAAHPDLRNERSYNIACWHLQGLLPACRNCNCLAKHTLRPGAVLP